MIVNPNVATKFKYEKYATFGYFISKSQNLLNGFFQNFRIPRNFKGKAWDILKIYLAHFCEESLVPRIGARPAAFDIGHAQVVESGGDALFVLGGEDQFLGLGAVAQGGLNIPGRLYL